MHACFAALTRAATEHGLGRHNQYVTEGQRASANYMEIFGQTLFIMASWAEKAAFAFSVFGLSETQGNHNSYDHDLGTFPCVGLLRCCAFSQVFSSSARVGSEYKKGP